MIRYFVVCYVQVLFLCPFCVPLDDLLIVIFTKCLSRIALITLNLRSPIRSTVEHRSLKVAIRVN